jgi:ribosomal protein L35
MAKYKPLKSAAKRVKLTRAGKNKKGKSSLLMHKKMNFGAHNKSSKTAQYKYKRRAVDSLSKTSTKKIKKAI